MLLITSAVISLLYSSLLAQDLTQKDKSVMLLEKLFSTEQDRSVLSFINEKKYIQHNLYARSSIDGLKSYLDHLKGKKLENKVIVAFEDADHVVTLSVSLQEDQRSKVIDIFRFEQGLIVEHWDNVQRLTQDENLKTIAVVDMDKTQKNKKLIQERVTQKVLEGTYLKNHMILAQGNFVLAVSELEKENQKVALYELFDVKNSKILNHWTIEETIPPLEVWKNANGKF